MRLLIWDFDGTSAHRPGGIWATSLAEAVEAEAVEAETSARQNKPEDLVPTSDPAFRGSARSTLCLFPAASSATSR